MKKDLCISTISFGCSLPAERGKKPEFLCSLLNNKIMNIVFRLAPHSSEFSYQQIIIPFICINRFTYFLSCPGRSSCRWSVPAGTCANNVRSALMDGRQFCSQIAPNPFVVLRWSSRRRSRHRRETASGASMPFPAAEAQQSGKRREHQYLRPRMECIMFRYE